MTSVNPPTPARREPAHTPLAGTLSKSNVCCVVLLCMLGSPAWGQTPGAIDCEANATCVGLARQSHSPAEFDILVNGGRERKEFARAWES